MAIPAGLMPKKGKKMRNMEPIRSTGNDKVKQMRALSTKKGRRQMGCFLVEGPKVLDEALAEGYDVKMAFVSEYAIDVYEQYEARMPVYLASEAVMRAMTDVDTPQTIVAAVSMPKHEAAIDEQDGLYLAMDAVQDPGNMGAILRCADAFGVMGVILGEGCADPYAPKSIRAAMGSTFHLALHTSESLENQLRDMQAKGAYLLATDLQGEEGWPDALPPKTVLMIGNEGNGLRPEIMALADRRFRLAMPGRSESLNAAVFTGIMLYALSQKMSR